MNKKNYFVVAAILFFYFNHVEAQKDSTDKYLEEVVVTANKYPQKKTQTAKVVTVISKNEIQNSANQTVGQLLNEVAGVAVAGVNNSPGSVQSVYMRGAGYGRTLILLDGIPVYDPSLIGSEFDINLLPIASIEKIEILRGAASTLYGSDAEAGVINIITTNNDLQKKIEVNAGLSYGSYKDWKANAKIAGKVDWFKYAVGYNFENSKGFSSAYSNTDKGFEKDGITSQNVVANFGFDLSKKISLKPFLFFTNNKWDIDDGQFTDAVDYTTQSKLFATGVKFDYANKYFDLKILYRYDNLSREIFKDTIQQKINFYKTNNYGNAHFAEVIAKYSLQKNIHIIAGVDYKIDEMKNNSLSIFYGTPYESIFPKQSAKQGAAYATAIFSFIDADNTTDKKINAELGGRINFHSEYGNNFTYSFNLSYLLKNNFQLLGSVASAFKDPSLYQLFSDYGNKNLIPEKSNSFEVGFSHRLQKLSNRVVFFYQKTKDGLDFDYVNYKYYNYAKQTSTGIELETTYKPTTKLSFNFNYTFLAVKENVQSRVTTHDTTYQYALRRPKHSVNLSVNYAFAKNWFAGSQILYRSKRFDSGGYQQPDVDLADYFLWNLKLGFTPIKNISLFTEVNNLLDKKYFELYGYTSEGINLRGGVRVRF